MQEPRKPTSNDDLFWVELQGSPQAQPQFTSDRETIASLQADVEGGLAEYALRHFDRVKRTIEEVRKGLNRLPAKLSPEWLETERCFLEGSVLSLKGRLMTAEGQAEDAVNAFEEAVSQFRKSGQVIEDLRRRRDLGIISLTWDLKELVWQKSAIRALTDYGIALMRVSHRKEAIGLLDEVCGSVSPPPEAFSYLGRAYQEENNLSKAEETLQRGLLHAPRDPKVLQYLAETLADAGKEAEAGPVYREAARAALRVDDLGTAEKLARRALDIDPEEMRAVELLVRIELLLEKTEEVKVILEKVLTREPSQPWALGMKGLLQRRTGDISGAVETLQKVEVETGDRAWILVELAEALYWKYNEKDKDAMAEARKDALEKARKAVDLAPQNTDAHHLLGRILLDVEPKPSEEAFKQLERAEELGPVTATLLSDLGRAHFQRGEYAEAHTRYDQAITSDTRCASAYFGKAKLLRAEKKTEKALYLAERAQSLAMTSGKKEVFLWIIDLLEESGETQMALDKLERHLQAGARDLTESYAMECYLRKGQILKRRNQEYRKAREWENAETELAAAAEALEEAVKLGPKNRDVLFELAGVARNRGDYRRGGEVYAKLVELQPNNAYALYNRALYFSEVAAFGEACEYLTKALRLEPQKAWMWGLMGWCLEFRGPKRIEEAYSAYEKAVAFSEGEENPVWYKKGLANTLVRLGRTEEASKILREVVQAVRYAKHEDASILWALSWCYYRLEENDEAVRLLQAAQAHEAESEMSFDLGLILLSSGRISIGKQEYERALEITAKRDKLRQRGVYFVALSDLGDAVAEGRVDLESVRPLSAKLNDALERAGVKLSEHPWLQEHLVPSNSGRDASAVV